MRLTVHVANAKKERIEVKSKQDPKTTIIKEVINNTFSFSNIQPRDVDRILSEIESEGLGIPVKHYLSRDMIIGRPHKKIKN